MANPTRSKKPQPRPAAAPAEPEKTSLTIRGFTPEDNAALERATARRREAIGGAFVSQNSTILALLRAALAAEESSGVIGGARTEGT